MEVDSALPPPAAAAAAMRAGGGGVGPAGFFTSPVSGGSPEGSWVQRDDLDLVEKTVEDFRHQRISMVQSLRQYVLCYESIMEWIVEQGPGSV
jgi:hypothetical protein